MDAKQQYRALLDHTAIANLQETSPLKWKAAAVILGRQTVWGAPLGTWRVRGVVCGRVSLSAAYETAASSTAFRRGFPAGPRHH